MTFRSVRQLLPHLLTALYLLVAANALARPMTSGAEFEFFAPETFEPGKHHIGEEEIAYLVKFKNLVAEQCAECKIEEHIGKFINTEYKVTFKNGWWFNLSVDPCVVEVQTKPSTLAEWRRVEKRLDRYVFATARLLNLKTTSSGHFNFGLDSAFGNSGVHFLSFFVDYANHPELGRGILGLDGANAPTMAELEDGQRTALQDIIREVLQGKLTGLISVTSAILDRVYTATPIFTTGPDHYQAFSIKYASHRKKYRGKYKTDPPGELRAVRAQKSTSEFMLLHELVEARKNYVKSANIPLLYLGKDHEFFEAQELVSRFYAYINETGLKWERFKVLMPPALDSVPPDEFVTGKLTLNEPSDFEILKPYILDVLTSPFIRERFEKTISSPEAIKNGLGLRALNELIAQAKAVGSPQARPALKQIVNEILATEPWLKATREKPALLKAITKKLAARESLFERVKQATQAAVDYCTRILRGPR